jgi:hypothetical protein
MSTRQSWTEITYSKGRYLPKSYCSDEAKKDFIPYKEDRSKLVWNVFNEENGEITPINIFEYNWVFLEEGLLVAKKKYKDNFEAFADHIRNWLQYCYWTKSEYETIITTWPPYVDSKEVDRLVKEKTDRLESYGNFIGGSVTLTVAYKIDIYTQVMMNWDRFIDYVWNNKHLITEKKLGLK